MTAIFSSKKVRSSSMHRPDGGARPKGVRAMQARRPSLIVVTAVLLAASGAWAQALSAWIEPYVKVEWQIGFRKGHPIVWGYIYNQRGMYATRVRILIEQLDRTGKSVGSQTAWVPGDLPRFGRAYFEQPVPTADATYRVSVISLDWFSGGGGGG